ncbi:hypothetical protein V6N13_061106 [Hibiscus sabdariffa]
MVEWQSWVAENDEGSGFGESSMDGAGLGEGKMVLEMKEGDVRVVTRMMMELSTEDKDELVGALICTGVDAWSTCSNSHEIKVLAVGAP